MRTLIAEDLVPKVFIGSNQNALLFESSDQHSVIVRSGHRLSYGSDVVAEIPQMLENGATGAFINEEA